MPYVNEEARRVLEEDNHIGKLADLIAVYCEQEATSFAGCLNYAITRLVDEVYSRYGTCYTDLNEAVGVLECVKQEYYRRLAVPYEDEKIEQNGDVYARAKQKD